MKFKAMAMLVAAGVLTSALATPTRVTDAFAFAQHRHIKETVKRFYKADCLEIATVRDPSFDVLVRYNKEFISKTGKVLREQNTDTYKALFGIYEGQTGPRGVLVNINKKRNVGFYYATICVYETR